MTCSKIGRGARADARREHVLETAKNLFCEQGFHRTGVAQIAAASGVKVGQIYRDFDSKEDIIAAICEAGVADWLEEDALAAAVSAQDPEAIRRWVGRFGKMRKPVEECRMMTEIVAEAGRNDRIAAINRTVDQRVRHSLEAALAALAPDDAKESDRARLADLIMALRCGVAVRRVVEPELTGGALDCHLEAMVDRELDALVG